MKLEDTRTIAPSLLRYLDGDAPDALHPCQAKGCTGFTMCSDFCPRCTEELDALQAWKQRRALRRAHGNPVSRLWRRLMNWMPTDSQLHEISAWLEWAGRVGKDALLIFMILVGLYLFCEIGSAFLPGGAVERILRGGR